jgi:predicted permease
VLVFGRLARGVTRDQAQAELTTIGRRMAADAPGTHEFLRPEVVPFAHLVVDPRRFNLALTLANIFLVMLIVVVAANVALLLFSRAASREVEIGVRHALGASRWRIVSQLVVEAMALSGLSAIAGLAATRFLLASSIRTREADRGVALPFWVTDSLTPSTIAYGVALTMLVAVIIGVFPALKITGGRFGAGLKSSSAGGGGYRFGGVWTAVIAAQVAVTVLFPATAFFFHRAVVSGQSRDVGFSAAEYLSARLAMDDDAAERTASLAPAPRAGARVIDELRRQLTAETGVTVVALADRLPGMYHPGGRFELEGDDQPPTYGYDVRIASVDAEFFGAVNAPVLSGRGFAPTDLAQGREVAVVNASFVQRVLRGRNPVGHRIRVVRRDGERRPSIEEQHPWIEIVGVVRDLGMIGGADGAGLYRPLASSHAAVHVAVHVQGAPESYGDRLRAVASRVEPTLRVYDVMPLDRVGADQWLESQYMSRLLAVLSGLALLLSLTAIYSVLAFTVTQRTREIGVRVALGANRWRVVSPIVGRPLVQIGLGIGVGGGLVALTFIGLMESIPTPLESGMIAAYALFMLTVCVSACVVPIRRALRLQPSQVLRADG